MHSASSAGAGAALVTKQRGATCNTVLMPINTNEQSHREQLQTHMPLLLVATIGYVLVAITKECNCISR